MAPIARRCVSGLVAPVPWVARASRYETGEDEPAPAISELLTMALGLPVSKPVRGLHHWGVSIRATALC